MKNKVHLILFAAGLIILALLIRDFGPENILINIEKLGWWFAAASGLWGLVYLQNAAAWYVIIGPERRKVAFWRVYTISLSSFAINYVTPFLSLGGEPYRISAIREFVGIERSVSSVTLYRMIHVLAHLFFWVLTIPLSYILLPEIHKYTFALLLFFLIVSLLILFLFYGLRKGFLYALYNITGRYMLLRFIYRKAERYREKLLTIDLQIKELYNSRKGAFWTAVMFELLSRFSASIEFFFILTAIGYDVSIPHAFYIHSISSLFMN
ncbi:MAG: lysylphosphatidylglycerol synthase transmembrane domain-containing protein, partial [Syntrophothermus sp.]